MINKGKEWNWMDNMDIISSIREDMKWVEKVLSHKDNTNLHYPALKRIINNFYNKWVNSNNITVMNTYRLYLKSILRSEFGR